MAMTTGTTAFRLSAAAIAAIVVFACGQAPPTVAPTVRLPSASATPPASSPSVSLPIDDPAYLAGDAFDVQVGETGADWTAPTATPVMPDGRVAARVAFLPASCATGDFTIDSAPAPADAWEADLETDGTEHGYSYMSWPAAQVPECAAGEGWGYLQIAYRPFKPIETTHLVVSITNALGAPSAVEVIPVYTAADATQPAFTSTGFVAVEAQPGPEKARGDKATQIATSGFNRATLPDGSAPTHWGLTVTGCEASGPGQIVITARVGGEASIEVGRCSEGGLTNGVTAWALPADGTPVEVLITGGTTKTQVRVSEFQWRGDRP